MPSTQVLLLLVLGVVLAAAAGAISGMKIGAEATGKELAAMLGALYGPTAVLPAVVMGLVILDIARQA